MFFNMTPFARFLLLVTVWPLAAHGQVHEHGAARLDIALDAKTLSLQFEAPLESLFGFERAPRTAAERQQVEAGLARLKSAQQLFKLDPAAGCTLGRVELNSAVLKLGSSAAATTPLATHGEHADLDASIEFTCKDMARLKSIEVGLFEAFTRLQRVEVQLATPQGQSKRSLKRGSNRIALPR